MNTLFLFLILIPIVLCNNSLPNYQYTRLGLDMKIGQPLNSAGAFRSPIFASYTFSQGKTINIYSNTYNVPDQLSAIQYGSEQSTSTVQVFYSESNVTNALFESFTTGFDCKKVNGLFALSEQVSTFNYNYNIEASYSAVSYLIVTSYFSELSTEIKLDPVFHKALMLLPDEFNDSTMDIFKDFIRTYGTSFSTRQVYGGSVNMITSFSTDIAYELNTEEIIVGINTQFMFASANSTLDKYQQEEYNYLNTLYKSSFVLVGGNPATYNQTEISKWIGTIPENPVYVRLQFSNLSWLLPRNETGKINALDEAIEYYFNN